MPPGAGREASVPTNPPVAGEECNGTVKKDTQIMSEVHNSVRSASRPLIKKVDKRLKTSGMKRDALLKYFSSSKQSSDGISLENVSNMHPCGEENIPAAALDTTKTLSEFHTPNARSEVRKPAPLKRQQSTDDSVFRKRVRDEAHVKQLRFGSEENNQVIPIPPTPCSTPCPTVRDLSTSCISSTPSQGSPNINVIQGRDSEAVQTTYLVASTSVSMPECEKQRGGKSIPSPNSASIRKKRNSIEAVPIGDNVQLETLLREKKFNDAFASIEQWISHSVVPNETVISKIVTDFVLPKTTGRAKRSSCTEAAMKTITSVFRKMLEKGQNILKTAPWEDSLNIIFGDLQKNLRKRNPPENFVVALLGQVEGEAFRKEGEVALQLFDAFTELVAQEFECNKKRAVKVRYPQVISLMAVDDFSKEIASFNSNWDALLSATFRHAPDAPITGSAVKWVDLLVRHYLHARGGVEIVEDDIEVLATMTSNYIAASKREYNIPFIKLFEGTEFASLLCEKRIFALLPDLPDVNSTAEWKEVLMDISNAVPSYGCHDEDASYVVPEKFRSEHENVCKKINMKGETSLHKAAQTKNNIIEVADTFTKMRNNRYGDINLRDNGGNTPLHDAAFYDNIEVIDLMYKYFVRKNEPRSPWLLDILAQDNNGDTALHNAVEKDHDQVALRLVTMSQVLGRTTLLLYKLRNKRGHTAWDLLAKKSKNTNNDVLLERIKEIAGSSPELRVHYGGYRFSQPAAMTIESDPFLWKLVTVWRQLQQ